MFFDLGDGDVECGVVLGGSVGVVFGSMVQDFAGWSWRLNRGHWCRHRWRRWCRLNDGCQVCSPAATPPQKVAYSE